MIKFYFNASPNPTKVALFLEETGLAYEPVPVDTRKGEQFAPGFVAINPNSKVPVIVDGDQPIFDSNAILLYLADKTGQFAPAPGDAQRGELLSWLMFVATGLGPYSGQAVHFRHFAGDGQDYARKRYDFEAHRHFRILDERLATHKHLLGEDYSIVDMAFWGWARMAIFILGNDAREQYPNVTRLVDAVSARPAAERAAALKDRFPFKGEFDAEARRNMFRHVEA